VSFELLAATQTLDGTATEARAIHAELAAEIAVPVSLSVRTVESYIYRATTKLGVNDRSALAGLLAGPRS
jgi:hypothetical protein